LYGADKELANHMPFEKRAKECPKHSPLSADEPVYDRSEVDPK